MFLYILSLSSKIVVVVETVILGDPYNVKMFLSCKHVIFCRENTQTTLLIDSLKGTFKLNSKFSRIQLLILSGPALFRQHKDQGGGVDFTTPIKTNTKPVIKKFSFEARTKKGPHLKTFLNKFNNFFSGSYSFFNFISSQKKSHENYFFPVICFCRGSQEVQVVEGLERKCFS